MKNEPSPLFFTRSIFDQLELFEPFGSEFAIICDETVAGLYGNKLKQNLHCQLFAYHPGEKSKTRVVKQEIEDQLLQNGFSSDTTIIALGGGVTTDLAGFVAATYLRGVKLIIIPTTLLAMVDAAIGSKRAVNTPYAKNSIGALYPADAIWIDTVFLKSLSESLRLEGYSEMLKHALILSEYEFKFFEENGLPTQDLLDPIRRSVSIKQAVIEQDRTQKGYRDLLNFGHTVAHALEKLSDYSIPHGIAVAYGMLIESYLSYLEGHLSESEIKRIVNIIRKSYAPLGEITYSLDNLWQVMQRDKKSKQGIPRQVHLKRIGKAIAPCAPIDKEQFKRALIWYNDVVSQCIST